MSPKLIFGKNSI